VWEAILPLISSNSQPLVRKVVKIHSHSNTSDGISKTLMDSSKIYANIPSAFDFQFNEISQSAF
jgi:hypothetical protein